MEELKTASSAGAESRWDRRGVILGLAMLAVLAAYSAAPLGDFVWDDVLLILEQGSVREMQPIWTYFDRMFFGGPEGAPTRAFYRPLVVLSFALDWKVWGGSPLGFHLTNLFLHLGSVALVFLCARLWGATVVAAGIGAAIFGVFPRLSEAVAWISGRTDLLATFFVLGGLWLHLRYPTRRWSAAFLLFLALLSKEVAIAGMVALGVLEVASGRREKASRSQLVLRVVPIGSALLSYLGLRLYVSSGYQAAAQELTLGYRLLTALDAAGQYVWMVLDPLRPRTQIGTLGYVDGLTVCLGIGAVAGLLWGLTRLLRRRGVWGREAALLSLILIPILLVLHLIPLPLNVVAADRFIYLSTAAAMIWLVVSASSWAPRVKVLATYLGIATICVFSVSTYARTLDWQHELSLWSEAVENRPLQNPYPLFRLAEVLIRLDRAEEALPLLEQGRRIEKTNWEARRLGDEYGSLASLGLAHVALEELDEAEAIFARLAEARKHDPTNLFNLAVLRGMKLDFTGALADLDSILQDYPDHEWAREKRLQIDRLQRRWENLPPRPVLDSSSQALERAEILWDLGRRRSAEQIWMSLAESANADPRSRAIAHERLVRQGSTRLNEIVRDSQSAE